MMSLYGPVRAVTKSFQMDGILGRQLNTAITCRAGGESVVVSYKYQKREPWLGTDMARSRFRIERRILYIIVGVLDFVIFQTSQPSGIEICCIFVICKKFCCCDLQQQRLAWATSRASSRSTGPAPDKILHQSFPPFTPHCVLQQRKKFCAERLQLVLPRLRGPEKVHLRAYSCLLNTGHRVHVLPKHLHLSGKSLMPLNSPLISSSLQCDNRKHVTAVSV